MKYFTRLQDKQKILWILNCEELDIHVLKYLGRFLQISLIYLNIISDIYTFILLLQQ